MIAYHLWCATRFSTWPSSFSIIYNDDLPSLPIVSHSTVKLFADDVTIYKKIVCAADAALLQNDLRIKHSPVAKTWLLHLNSDKCQSIVLSNKHSPPIPCYCI